MPFSSAAVGWRTHVATWTRFFIGNRLGPYHEMSSPIVRSMLKLAGVNRSDHLVDLGCGDGRILIAAAELGANKCTGFELDKKVAAVARSNVRRKGMEDRITVLESDARKADLSSATVITLYLSERGNTQLLPVLKPLLHARPATRVVSFLFPITAWTPVKMELTDQSNIPQYLYTGESLPDFVPSSAKSKEEAQ